jgi:hypothetical protein
MTAERRVRAKALRLNPRDCVQLICRLARAAVGRVLICGTADVGEIPPRRHNVQLPSRTAAIDGGPQIFSGAIV